MGTIPLCKFRRHDVLARQTGQPLPLLAARAGAVIVAGVLAHEVHVIADSVTNHRVVSASCGRAGCAVRDEAFCLRQ